MIKSHSLSLFCSLAIGSLASTAHAVSSAELYTTEAYPYGRFEARLQFAGGDGVVASFFLWKDGSEQSGVFWNELDLETVWADCELKTNALYGDPEANHSQDYGSEGNLCGTFHTYAYEWTPDYIAWFIDGKEIRRATGADAAAFSDNAPDGMQIHFNLWPGDSTFGGNFSPSILPVFEYINWVQFSSYANGQFQLEWREDFSGDTLPEGWVTGDWGSPKNLSTHSPANVAFIDGYAVLSMTADDATGSSGAAPMDPEGGGPRDDPSDPPMNGAGGAGGQTPNGAAGAAGMSGDPQTPDGNGPVPGSGGAGATPSGPGVMPGNDNPPGSGGTANSPGPTPTGTGDVAGPQPIDTGVQPVPPNGPDPTPAVPTPGTDPTSDVTGAGTSGAPTQTAASAPGTPAASAPTVMPSETSDGGGCRMAEAPTFSRWPWLALLLGLSAAWARRRGHSNRQRLEASEG